MERITIVLRPGLGLNFEAMRPALQAGATVAIGRGGAVIESVLDEDHPADEALKPGIFDVITGTACITGDGSGEALPPLEEHLAQVENVGDALRDEHLRANQVTESLGILERWIEKAEHTDGYVGVVEIEAVEIVADELRRLRQSEIVSSYVIRHMCLDITAVGEALGISAEDQEGGTGEFIDLIEEMKVARAGQVPEGVRAWFEAKQAHVNAVNAYNARLKFVREHLPFGTSVDPEYQLMEAAERNARSLIGPMFEELRQLLASPAHGGE